MYVPFYFLLGNACSIVQSFKKLNIMVFVNTKKFNIEIFDVTSLCLRNYKEKLMAKEKETDNFIMIPKEIWEKGIDNREYLSCYCFIVENLTFAYKVSFTKKMLYTQLRVKRKNIKDRVDSAMQIVLNDICQDDQVVQINQCGVNELICTYIDKNKLKRKEKTFSKIYFDDLMKLEAFDTAQQNYQDMLLLLCYYRSGMINRRPESTVEIAPPMFYKYLIDINTELNMPVATISRCLEMLNEIEIINLYRLNTKKINNNYITGKLIIYDYVNRDELYSNEEILNAAIKYVNKKSKEQ